MKEKLKKMNPFKAKSKERIFDPSPKMKAEGTVYITKLTLSNQINKTQSVCVGEHMIFSEVPVPDGQIFELAEIARILKDNPDCCMEKSIFECELLTVKTEIMDTSKGGENS